MTARDLRAKRAAERIPGRAISKITNISKSRLSDLENEVIVATAGELRQIDAAIESIVRTRQQLTKLAAESGLCLTGVRI